VAASLSQSVLIGFEEDRQIIQAQQRSLQLDPTFPVIGLRMDSALGIFRGMMERLITAE